MANTTTSNSTPRACPECGYDLTGHLAEAGEDAFRCPECGDEVSRAQLEAIERDRLRNIRIGPVWLGLALSPSIVLTVMGAHLETVLTEQMAAGCMILVSVLAVALLVKLCIHACWGVQSIFEHCAIVSGMVIVLLCLNSAVVVVLNML